MKLLDLDNHTTIRLAEDRSSFAFMDEAGTGRVVKGVNTTPDVGVNEIPRQAAKFKIRVNRDGYPPVARSDGKIPKLESADINEANKWLKAGAVAAALAGAGMGGTARAQDTTSTNVAIQSQAQLVDPHFISKEAESEFLKLQTAWLKTGAWESREYNKKVEEGNKFLLNANNLGGVEYVKQVLTKDLTDWLKKTLPVAQKRNAQQSTERGQDSLSLLVDPTFISKDSPVFVVNRDKWLATNPRTQQIEDYNEMIDFFNRAVSRMGKDGRKKAIMGALHWLEDPRNAGRGFNESKR
jgi:hypothetical protein